MLPDFLRELSPAALFTVFGTAGLLWLAVMYLIVELVVRVHAWWTR